MESTKDESTFILSKHLLKKLTMGRYSFSFIDVEMVIIFWVSVDCGWYGVSVDCGWYGNKDILLFFCCQNRHNLLGIRNGLLMSNAEVLICILIWLSKQA